MSIEEAANPLQAFTKALQGLLFGFILVVFSLITIDFGSVEIGLTFLPLIAIVLWPNRASVSWSLVSMFLLGLFMDIVSGGPIGLWAFSYLVINLVIGENVRLGMGFLQSYWWFFVAIVIAIGLLFVLGGLVLGHWPRWQGLGFDMFGALFVFPIFYWLKTLVSPFSSTSSSRRTIL